MFGEKSKLDYGEKETSTFERFIDNPKIGEKCRPMVRDLHCRYHFPPCDTTLGKPQMRRICRRSCEYLDLVVCRDEMIFIKEAAPDLPYFDRDMLNCSLYDVANGGDAPECYQYHPLAGNCIDISTKRILSIETCSDHP